MLVHLSGLLSSIHAGIMGRCRSRNAGLRSLANVDRGRAIHKANLYVVKYLTSIVSGCVGYSLVWQVVAVGSGAFLTTTSKTATAHGATNILRQAQPPTTQQVISFNFTQQWIFRCKGRPRVADPLPSVMHRTKQEASQGLLSKPSTQPFCA